MLFGGVLPDHRRKGIGGQMLSWQMERGIEQLAGTDQRLPAHLMSYVYDFEDTTLDLFNANGFEAARFDHELLRSLGDLPPVPSIGGIQIRPWTEADNEPARRAFNASFADHWGSTSRSSDYWEHMIHSGGNRLDLSFVRSMRSNRLASTTPCSASTPKTLPVPTGSTPTSGSKRRTPRSRS